jgi:methanogenic corrinoid protein MtbC1
VVGERHGRQIRYRITTASLRHFVLMQEVEPDAELSIEDVQREFLESVLTLREEDAAQVVDRALARGATWKQLYLSAFVPALIEVGARWERGELPVAAEHLITGMVLRLIHRLSLTLPAAPSSQAPSALVGCVEGELHTVGGRMVADFLTAQGWRVWYLNGFLPMEHLLEAARRHQPDAVVLCISTPECGEALSATVEELRRWRAERPLPLIVAGGRYFLQEPEADGLDAWGTDIEAVTGEMDRHVTARRQL